MQPLLRVEKLSKTFVLHNQSSAELPVLQDANLEVCAGECVVLHGRSGSGKSTLLRALYGNYQANSGHIWLQHQGAWIDMAQAPAPRNRRLGQPVSAGDPPRANVGNRHAAAAGTRRGSCFLREARQRPADTAECAGAFMVTRAIHFFRRRTAARQHRAWLYRRLSGTAAG